MQLQHTPNHLAARHDKKQASVRALQSLRDFAGAKQRRLNCLSRHRATVALQSQVLGGSRFVKHPLQQLFAVSQTQSRHFLFCFRFELPAGNCSSRPCSSLTIIAKAENPASPTLALVSESSLKASEPFSSPFLARHLPPAHGDSKPLHARRL